MIAWFDAYKILGLVIIGVHAPEYVFERFPANVAAGAARLGIKYPIALDDDFTTWTAYRDNYWLVEYLIDGDGQIRHITNGEGDYAATETLIRQLLTAANPGVAVPAPTEVDTYIVKPTLTPESYLGAMRVDLQHFAGAATSRMA